MAHFLILGLLALTGCDDKLKPPYITEVWCTDEGRCVQITYVRVSGWIQAVTAPSGKQMSQESTHACWDAKDCLQ